MNIRTARPPGSDRFRRCPAARRLVLSLALILALILALTLTASLAAAAPGKVALVIGNASYTHVTRLQNPANDARDIAGALTRLGFDVTLGDDLEYNQMRIAIRDFAEKAQAADMVVVYFAGHGIEIDNTNYLIPVNARLRSDRDVEFEAIRLDTLLRAIDGARGLRIVLVDACRNNPFLAAMQRSSATRSVGRGLARIDPGGILVGYSARGGTLALDGDGRNSPYAAAMLKYLEQPGLEIGKLFRKVRDDVFAATDGQQEPFTYGSLPGKDIFLKPPAPTPVGLPADGKQAARAAAIIADYFAAEAKGTASEWARFLDTYGDLTEHQLVALARKKHAVLQEEADRRHRALTREPWLKGAVGEDGRTVTLTAEHRKLIQTALSYMGHYSGPIDGEFGPQTRAAIARARLANNLMARGAEVDLALLRVLPDVRAVQSLQSDRARRYDRADLPEGLEPRLRRALWALSGRWLRFGYFEGHLYVVVSNGGFEGFHSASRLAAGIGGHLATVTSRDEDRFVYQLFSADRRFIVEHDGALFGPMFGLFQPDRSHEPRGGWAWVTGEPLTYTRWSPGNPDNHQGKQDYARYYRKAKMRSPGAGPDYWDDTTESWSSLGFVIEIE